MATAAKKAVVQGLEVIAKTSETFYRAGRGWSQTPTTIALTDLTKAEIEELKAEPLLIVREVELPAPESSEAEETVA